MTAIGFPTFFLPDKGPVGGAVDVEIEGRGEQVGAAGEVGGAEAAADAERREGGIGEDDALAGAALKFENEFGERRAAEAQQRRLPGEGAGNGHEVERLDRKTLKPRGGAA